MSANFQVSMCNGRAYIASKKNVFVRQRRISHGNLPASRASFSVIFTIDPDKPDPPTSAMTSARSVRGRGVDLEGLFRVTTTPPHPPPPTSLNKCARPVADLENHVSLLRSRPEKQESDHHRLGTVHGAKGGEASFFVLVFGDKHVQVSARDLVTCHVI